MQSRLDRRKAIIQRTEESIKAALDTLIELDIAFTHGWHSDLSREAPLEAFLESEVFWRLQRKLIRESMLITDKKVRFKLRVAAYALGWCESIAGRAGSTSGPTVGMELCDYASDLLGAYLRGEKPPESRPVARFLAIYQEIAPKGDTI
jgi:hypothetical protein